MRRIRAALSSMVPVLLSAVCIQGYHAVPHKLQGAESHRVILVAKITTQNTLARNGPWYPWWDLSNQSQYRGSHRAGMGIATVKRRRRCLRCDKIYPELNENMICRLCAHLVAKIMGYEED